MESVRIYLERARQTREQIERTISGIYNRVWIVCDPNREYFSGVAGGNAGNFVPRTREQVMQMCSWTLLHNFTRGENEDGHDRKIYGGFVRDYIVGGRVPNDIDVQISSADAWMSHDRKRQWVNDLIQQLQRDWSTACTRDIANSTGARLFSIKKNVATINHSIFFELHTITTSQFNDSPADGLGSLAIDCNEKNFFRGEGDPPGMTCDVDNISISKTGLALKKPKLCGIESPFSPLGLSMFHCIQREFVFFLEIPRGGGDVRRGTARERARRLQGRGWTWLNQVHGDGRNTYPDFWRLGRMVSDERGDIANGEFTYIGFIGGMPPPACLEIRVRRLIQENKDVFNEARGRIERGVVAPMARPMAAPAAVPAPAVVPRHNPFDPERLRREQELLARERERQPPAAPIRLHNIQLEPAPRNGIVNGRIRLNPGRRLNAQAQEFIPPLPPPQQQRVNNEISDEIREDENMVVENQNIMRINDRKWAEFLGKGGALFIVLIAILRQFTGGRVYKKKTAKKKKNTRKRKLKKTKKRMKK